MVRCISSITAAFGALLIANGVYGAPASGPVEKGFDLPTSERNAKPKKKKAADEEAAEEAEDTGKKKKGKKGKKEEPPPEEEVEEEKPKKKGKKGKKEEPPPEEEVEEEKPKKKGKKKGKKEEPPPEEEEVDVKDTESPTAEPEEELDEAPEEEPAEEAPADGDSEEEEGDKAEAAAAVSTDDLAGKLYIGARLGFGLFLGSATGDDPALVDFSNKIPIWLDLGYRITPSLMVGLYGQFAPATMACPEGYFCTGATVMRFGAQVQYGFAPDASFAPWAGLGIGYEIANGTLKTGGIEGKFSLKGVEFLNLQAGADFMVSKTVGVGPFLSFSLGRYASGDFEALGETDSGGIAKKEFHEWLVLGVRGSFSL